MTRILTAFMAVFLAHVAIGEEVRPDRGWHWYERPPVVEPKQEPVAEEPAPAPKEKPKEVVGEAKPPEQECTSKNWKPSCGFVDPGEDFEFQAQQRDELLKQMVIKDNDPKAVEAFQRYIKWVMHRASQVANLWQYNMVQNPELDPAVTEPVTGLGLELATKVKSAGEVEIFKHIVSEGASLVYFSRASCVYCVQMRPALATLKKNTGLPLRNAALDGECIAEAQDCVKGPKAVEGAQYLQVSIVPSLFLHIKPNTWIRIATGIVDASTMKNRIAQFFASYRHAMLRGIKNGSSLQAAQDGSYTWKPTGAMEGVKLPSSEEMATMLRGSGKK